MVVKNFVMLNHLLLLLLAARALAQKPAIDTGTLIDVFGTPPTGGETSTVSTTPLPATPSTTPLVVDKGGETCTCVPYYLCDANLVAVFKNNVTVTGWGELDIRFGENECQESVERCCKEPKDESSVMVPVTPVPLKGCGYRNRDGLDFTIKGGSGSEALFGEFPWVAALLNNDNRSYAGVGVLIHPQVVMTGAHIAYKYQAGGLTARLGEWDTHTTKERLRHQERIVAEISVHPEFRSLSLQNDVALLRLESPVELASHINVLCLPEQDESFQTSRGCVANGWGKDEFGDAGRFAVIMKRVELNMVESALCDRLLKMTKLGPKFRLHETFLCAGGEEGKDTCQGDGGAPLACPVGGDRYKLSGLVAWGISCGQRDVPAVYVNVAKFRQWVDAKLRGWGYDTSGYSV